MLDDVHDRANQQQATSEEVQKTYAHFAQRKAMQAWKRRLQLPPLVKAFEDLFVSVDMQLRIAEHLTQTLTLSTEPEKIVRVRTIRVSSE